MDKLEKIRLIMDRVNHICDLCYKIDLNSLDSQDQIALLNEKEIVTNSLFDLLEDIL